MLNTPRDVGERISAGRRTPSASDVRHQARVQQNARAARWRLRLHGRAVAAARLVAAFIFEICTRRQCRSNAGGGEPRILTEENAIDVLNECMADIGTMFGTEASSRGVGITGEVEFVELDGPILVVRLKGSFWHQRTRVVERVESYVLERIPECVEVVIEDAEQLDDSDPDELEMTLDKAFADPPVQFGNEDNPPKTLGGNENRLQVLLARSSSETRQFIESFFCLAKEYTNTGLELISTLTRAAAP